MLARMSSAVLVQRNGFGSAFVAEMSAWMAFSSSATERNTPRRKARSVSNAKKRSTRSAIAFVPARQSLQYPLLSLIEHDRASPPLPIPASPAMKPARM